MKLSQILTAENPLTGKKTSLLDLGGIFQMILGVVLLFFVVATGQNVAKAISARFPRIDTSIQPVMTSGEAVAATPRII